MDCSLIKSSPTETLELRLYAVRYEARDIVSLEWRALDGGPLPHFSPGAHIDLLLGAEAGQPFVRSYSLTNASDGDIRRYVVAVKRNIDSRGGSRFVHDVLRVGSIVRVSKPRNHFGIDERAQHSVLFAGGIGITPLWAMAQRLASLEMTWTLHYSARSREHAAFADELHALAAESHGVVHCHYDDQRSTFDLAAAIAGTSPDTHLYCCGPASMLAAFEAACEARDPATIHLERFAAPATSPSEGTTEFTVILARADRTLKVKSGQTILDTLLAAGMTPSFSCKEGVCGSCETAVLDGVPDHRDGVLSAAERASNRTMMICCSGSKSEVLVLDM
jgi:ferredoxin--NADP+ reductase/vanillate O-demethylase ferredoxin subunit